MTDVQLEQATERLQRKLNLTDPDGDTLALLGDELLDAEGELLLYLGWEALDETLMGKAVELAALYYQQDRMMERGYRSRNYSEGQVSQSDSYLTPDQMRETADTNTRRKQRRQPAFTPCTYITVMSFTSSRISRHL